MFVFDGVFILLNARAPTDGWTDGQTKTPEIAELVWRVSRHAGRESAAKFVSFVGGALAEHLYLGRQEEGEEGDPVFTREQLARLFVKVRWRRAGGSVQHNLKKY